jgi:hypothetical protein
VNSSYRPRQPYALRIVLVLIIVLTAIHPRNAFSLANCGIAANLTIPAGPAGCDVQFGLSRGYDDGVEPSIALLSTNLVLEVHKSEGNQGMWYRVGKLSGMTVTWGGSQQTGENGYWPTVVVSKEGYVILVHSSTAFRAGSGLWYRVGQLDPNGDEKQSITWKTGSIKWDAGFHSSVSMNNSGVIVGVHESGQSNDTGVYYRVGHLTNPAGGNYTITWDSGSNGIRYSGGINPHIAINNKGLVVEVHQVPGENLLHYVRGTLWNGKISFANDQPRYNSSAAQPSVALTDNGFVTEVHREVYPADDGGNDLDRTVGKLSNDVARIDWSSSVRFNFDTGNYPAIATNGSYVIQTHEHPDTFTTTLSSSTSAIRDRRNWMGDMSTSIGTKTLKDIVIPGSHDSGMYRSNGGLGLTQDQTLLEQLQGGVRYFDLRVKAGNPQYIYHGYSFIAADTVDKVTKDVATFMRQGGNEVVVLKFSHFLDFGNCETTDQYRTLRNTVVINLWPWLYTGNDRPSDVSLNNLAGRVVVVVDGDWAAPKCKQVEPGFYIYKDWCAGVGSCDSPGPASDGEFNVFDRYANTTNYDDMRNNQLDKLKNYNGKMEGDSNVAVDLFLLSWTLTPSNTNPLKPVSELSRPANRNLGEEMNKITPNQDGFIPNILYVDYYERARVTDTAITMTNRFNP